MSEPSASFTGRRRARVPSRRVKVADRTARWVIALGGVGSIVAVSLVGVFLVFVAAPLFRSGHVSEARPLADGAGGAQSAVAVGMDDGPDALWSFHPEGTFTVRDLASGRVVAVDTTLAGRGVTAWSFATEGTGCAFGLADGSVLLGELRFAARRLELKLEEPVPVGPAPIVLIDRSELSGGPMVAALDAERTLHVAELRRRRNMLTGETTLTRLGGSLALPPPPGLPQIPGASDLPAHLLLTGIGDNAMVAWPDGSLLRIDTRDAANLALVERLDLVPERGVELTSLEFLIGKSSLLAGDQRGRVRVWFRVRPTDAGTSDRSLLVHAYDLPAGEAAVLAIAPSSRSRLVAAGYADGEVRLMQTTTRRLLASRRLGSGAAVPTSDGARAAARVGDAVDALALSPRDDALLAAGAGGYAIWEADAAHSEVDLPTMLRPVWYEGYQEPRYVWQSSSGTDAFEPKYSLVPLIFGTLKATLYSMLFGLPLALMAAIYTSEFLSPRLKARVKPLIEMMASLPSVVLGFLAALVIAPYVAQVLPSTLTAFVTVPVAFLLGAHLWQLLPPRVAARLERIKLAFMALALLASLWAAGLLGPGIERLLFAGNVMAWLDGQAGSGLAGWLFLLLPLAALGAAVLQSLALEPWLRRISRGWSRRRYAAVDLAKFVLVLAAAAGGAALMAWLLSAAGWDPRGGVADTYIQRNAMVVGFVMGFAIIPIIYTIAEDALGAVPDHLRAASLGLGATPWQTAIRVIVPPAVSGLFSAVMIGLGRAVGETMIVLMAAGNTPIMDWNIFNGFRTLSANLAVELPEAVQNSTHYRVLFLAALTLFLMTFVLNTVAEAVRLRFRKKAHEL